MKKTPYTWVKRATQTEKEDMRECVMCANEMSMEEMDTHPFQSVYVLRRIGNAWCMVSYIDQVHPDFQDMYTFGQPLDTVPFVRCSSCGGIRTLAEEQIEFCIKCNKDW